MVNLKKCSGSLNFGDSVNCPLRFTCLKFKVESIGVLQEFIRPNYTKKNNIFSCQDYEQ